MYQDMFEHPELVPAEVAEILDRYGIEEAGDYKACRECLEELNAIGWTFDYGLDFIPYELHEAPSVMREMNHHNSISFFAQLWADGCEWFKGSHTVDGMAENFDCMMQVYRHNVDHNHLSLNISI